MSDKEQSVSPARSKSASRSASKEKSASREKTASPDKSHSASKSPERAERSRSQSYSRSRSRSRSKRRSHRSRSRSARRYSRSRSRSHRRRRSRSRSYSYDRKRSSKYDYNSDYRDSYRGSSNKGHKRSRSRSPMSSRRRHLGDRENPNESRCIGVFGLSLYTQERDLRDVFEQYGPIDEVQVVFDHQTGRSRGFAFIYMKNYEDALEAKEAATGTEIDGRKIRVDFSITKRAHTPTPGVYLGRPTMSGFRGRGGGMRSRSPHYGARRNDFRHRSRSYSRSYSRSPRRY